MKHPQTIYILAAAFIATSCSQTTPYGPQPGVAGAGIPQETAQQRQFLALPGQSAVQVGTEDTDAAFDRQVSAYNGGEVTVQDQPAAPAQPAPPVAAPAENQPPAYTPAPATASADFAVQITNGTTGRLYVEAQDAAGHIFPCGAMFAGQSISALPDPVGPLKGPITVVIRDPDKDGAPEIRRYKVDPPASYVGKTIGITILPGGQYRADVDNKVYYTSPAPQQPAQ